ncbi:porin [Paraburkholderia caribensis]|uniref:porin n=1 Tax=Paraburkholderia caribensis TaxID=75105 RepID=UPI001CB46180|nr:porin [Paraburkholderia caribensis]CAG9243761.1 Porin Gram-negative type [Paraburkholderia caribensis]
MKHYVVASLSLLASTAALAQSSVTLYGLIDEGFGYTSNAGGKSAWQMQSGWVAGDRWGLKGNEDLGGGLSAIFTLENGFNLNNGALGNAGRIFGRQAFVGIQTANYGSLTFGRQYDSIVDFLAPLTANGGYAGWPFAHPFDNDNTDETFRVNNAIKYTSPKFYGAQFGGLYAFSNQAGGFADNRLFSVGASYTGGALSLAATYLQADHPGLGTNGALVGDTNFTAKRQQVWGAAALYAISSLTLGFNYTHTTLQSPTGSVYFGNFAVTPDSLKFDNFEVSAKYQFTPFLSAIAMYTYTQGRLDSSGKQEKPKWHQGGLMVDYYLSKRTDLYAQAAYQHVTGDTTGTALDQAFITGSAGAASGRSQVLCRIGMKHTF